MKPIKPYKVKTEAKYPTGWKWPHFDKWPYPEGPWKWPNWPRPR